MRIQFASDLHLEFKENRAYLKSNPLEVSGDILLLAGDVFYFNKSQMNKIEFFKWASDNYREVIIVPGNHEYYGVDLKDRGDCWQYRLYKNLTYYSNKMVRIDDTDFILSTLWSYIPDEYALSVSECMNDFKMIKFGNRNLGVSDYNERNEADLTFIKECLGKSTAPKRVVVSHHLPLFDLLGENCRDKDIACAYASNLSDLMNAYRIDYWIHGHSHECTDLRMGGTRILSNQLGYVLLGQQHRGFDCKKAIEL